MNEINLLTSVTIVLAEIQDLVEHGELCSTFCEDLCWKKGLRKCRYVCVLSLSVVSDSLQPHGL